MSAVAVDRPAPTRSQLGALVVGAAVVLAGYVPLVFLGPGTDLDVPGVYRAGTTIWSDAAYEPSRRPGAPVYEAIAGLLHLVGGVVLVNLASVVATVVLAGAVYVLLRGEGVRWPEWFAVAVLLNPFVWIAGTSMIEHVWALTFALAGLVLLRRGRAVPAGVLLGLALGCRLPIVVVVAAFYLGLSVRRELPVRVLARSAGVAVAVGVAVLVPSYLVFGTSMLDTDLPPSSPGVRLARAAVKNFYFFGPVFLGVAMVVVARASRRLGRLWVELPLLRCVALGFVASELLFAVFPLKLAHLLPAFVLAVMCLALLRPGSRAVVVAVVASQVLLALVGVNLAEPDRPGAATGGSFAPTVEAGPLVVDVRCRLDGDREAYRREGGADEVLATWACVNPWSDD